MHMYDVVGATTLWLSQTDYAKVLSHRATFIVITNVIIDNYHSSALKRIFKSAASASNVHTSALSTRRTNSHRH